MKPSAIIGALGVLLAGSLYMNVSAQESGSAPGAVAMTGDSKAAWILLDSRELVYCWWPEGPDTRTRQASCRVLDKFKVNRIQ